MRTICEVRAGVWLWACLMCQLSSTATSLLYGNHADGTAASVTAIKAGAPTSTARMKFLVSTLEKFDKSAVGNQKALEQRHEAEEVRLRAALDSTSDAGVRAALQRSIANNEASLLETKKIYGNMGSFSDSMSNLLNAAQSKGSACEVTTCGLYASCTDTTEGAQCVCNEGYVGAGHACSPPADFRPERILFEGAAGIQTSAWDMDVCVFEKNKIAIVFRDESKGDIGRIVVGAVREGGLADLAPPEQFTIPEGRAYNPVVQGSPDNRILIAWRGEARGGTGWMRAAAMGVTGIRGADRALTWGSPLSFASGQAHKMALVNVDNSRFALMFSEHTMPTVRTPMESFGNAVLAEVDTIGAVSSLGTFRFTDAAVTRLVVTKLTKTSFVLAARASPLLDDMNASATTRQEALAIFGEVVGNDIVFNPKPVSLEPTGTHIWGRGLSLVAPNTFAYAYQEGVQKQIKMAVLHVNPDTHVMKVVRSPMAIRSGFSPYVSMLSVPYTAADPHTLTFYESANSSMVNICSWAPQTNTLDKCEDFAWFNQTKLRSVAGVHLGGGKSFMVFSTEAGTPHYTVYGLSKK